MHLPVVIYIFLLAKCLALPGVMQLYMDKDRGEDEWNARDNKANDRPQNQFSQNGGLIPTEEQIYQDKSFRQGERNRYPGDDFPGPEFMYDLIYPSLHTTYHKTQLIRPFEDTWDSEKEPGEFGYRVAIGEQEQSDDSNIQRIQGYEEIYYPEDTFHLYDNDETTIGGRELSQVDKSQALFIHPFELSHFPNTEGLGLAGVYEDSNEEPSGFTDFGMEDQIDDYSTQKRNKRAAVFPVYELGTALLVKGLHAVRHLLKGATSIDNHGKLQVFQKSGGLSQAMRDFDSVRPSGRKVIDTGPGTFVWKGTVGDRKLVLTSKNTDGLATLEITKNKQLNIRVKGQFRDLPDELVKERIVYTKTFPPYRHE